MVGLHLGVLVQMVELDPRFRGLLHSFLEVAPVVKTWWQVLEGLGLGVLRELLVLRILAAAAVAVPATRYPTSFRVVAGDLVMLQ